MKLPVKQPVVFKKFPPVNVRRGVVCGSYDFRDAVRVRDAQGEIITTCAELWTEAEYAAERAKHDQALKIARNAARKAAHAAARAAKSM
jgi:hypothetical protein